NDSGEPNITTDASGNYSFANLGPGTYHVREVLPTGWAQTTTNPADLVPTSGTNVSGLNFSVFQRFSLSGQVYNDVNGNAARDTGEPGLQGLKAFPTRHYTGLIDTGEPSTTTDASGSYSFANLGPGTYHVREVLQTDWISTTTGLLDVSATSGT